MNVKGENKLFLCFLVFRRTNVRHFEGSPRPSILSIVPPRPRPTDFGVRDRRTTAPKAEKIPPPEWGPGAG